MAAETTREETMEIVAVIALLALVEYVVFAMLVGRARGLYKVEAPAVTGHPVFERYFRVQQNTLELLVVFLPALWLFGHYLSPLWAAILGGVFLLGRLLYLRGYVADPKRREIGFGLSMIPVLLLLAGGLWGALRAAL